jgi:DNA (cytosine-5)-methyltransferase 1
MKVLDLFSGIGGFSLGLEWAGMETIAMCEKDKFCRQVLAKHWPDITIHEDIRNLDGKDYKGSIDVVCGGFPCQPFSVAGKQLGKADDRHLWPEMLRVIKESAPTWVIGENVSGFVRMALDDVCSDLEGEGYRSPIVCYSGLCRRSPPPQRQMLGCGLLRRE